MQTESEEDKVVNREANTEEISSIFYALNRRYDFCKKWSCKIYNTCELISELDQFAENNNCSKSKENKTELNTNVFSYDSEEFKRDCIFGHPHVTPIECEDVSVTDGIGNHYKIELVHSYDKELYKIKKDTEDTWEAKQAVFISAPCGQGKNYFIEKTLLPYLRQLNLDYKTNYKILILSNRLALKQQIKKHIVGYDDTYETDGKIYTTYEGNVHIMTYQSILKQKKHLENQQKTKNKYLYIICDEAHFFTSDAMFNPDTEKILSTIVSIFDNAIRVYMSATPYECLSYIADCEHKYFVSKWERKHPYDGQGTAEYIAFYHFKRDYSYLKLKSYSQIEELFNKIITSVNNGEKWIIFIDDKEKCADVKTKLEQQSKTDENGLKSLEGKIFAVNADSKKNELYQQIILKEQLINGISVLISTSVLDNGVNLKNIDNIVISDMSKVKCIQMVGRARIDRDMYGTPMGIKTLYVKRFDNSYVIKRRNSYIEQEDAYHDLDLAFESHDHYNIFIEKFFRGNEHDWINGKHWFCHSKEKKGEFYINEIAKSLVKKRIRECDSILAEMEDEAKQHTLTACQDLMSIPGQRYLKYQFSWFGKKYCIDNDITLCDKNTSKNELLSFLESYIGKEMDKESQKAFRDTFTKLHDEVFPREDRNKDRKYGIDLINAIFKKRNLGFRLDGKMNSAPWIVIKIEEQTKTTK